MTQPLCPKCGDPVVRKAHKNGVVRYGHRGNLTLRRHKGLCGWNGTQAVGWEEDQAKGVDRQISKQLAKKVRGTGKRRVVITSAQNATPVNKAFLATLLGYCKARKAQLIVIPYRYKNPTSHWSSKAVHDDWWAPEVVPYLMDQRVELNPNLILLGDIKTQPTATAPLQGFENLTGSKSGIIGHPKLELFTVPTPQSKMAKIMVTTGAVTEMNYIPSKAGKKAQHHHSFAAAIVEIDGKKFHLRQLNACKDGSFCDLEFEYNGDKVTRPPPPSIVMGDSHIKFIDPGVKEATFGPKGIIKSLGIKRRVWHDFVDGYAGSHHHKDEVFIKYVKHHTKNNNVEAELDQAFKFIDDNTYPGDINIFVPSNHPDHIAKWVKSTDPRNDPTNCVFWAETFKVMCLGATWGKAGAITIDPVEYWAKRKLKTANQAFFPGRNDSYLINGIEIIYHGDIGANGARGSLAGFARLGVKTVTAHGHAPGIKDGAYRVGTSSLLNLEYAKGPSGWMHTHCLIYSNGKRSLINIIGNEWRA
jgi:hypothetical protein